MEVQNAPNAKSALWSTLALQKFQVGLFHTSTTFWEVLGGRNGKSALLGTFGVGQLILCALGVRPGSGRIAGPINQFEFSAHANIPPFGVIEGSLERGNVPSVKRLQP